MIPTTQPLRWPILAADPGVVVASGAGKIVLAVASGIREVTMIVVTGTREKMMIVAIVNIEFQPGLAGAAIISHNTKCRKHPDPKNLAAQHAILDDREWPYYEHRMAA